MKLVVRQMDTTYPVLRIRGVFVPKNRVLHARITDDTHEKLTRVCSEIGCSITDYVISVLDESFDQEPSDVEQKPSESTGNPPRPEIKPVIRISNDGGKTWYDAS